MDDLSRLPGAAQLSGLRLEVRRFLGKRLHSSADADDLAQDAFVRWLGSAEADQPVPPRPLLFSIARNLLTDHWRRQQVRSGSG